MFATMNPDPYPGARYVDKYRSEIIQKSQRVMAVAQNLLSKNVINVDTYSQIRRTSTKQERIRKLFAVLDEGGDGIKSAFYSALRNNEYGLCHRDLSFEDFLLLELCSIPQFDREARFVDRHRNELIQRLTEVMPVLDELLAQHKLNDQTYEFIRRASTSQEQMRELYKVLDQGGNEVKYAFYTTLRKYNPRLFFYVEFKAEISQYKSFIIDQYMFETENNFQSDDCVTLVTCYTEPLIIQKSKVMFSNDKNQSITIDQLFSPDSDGSTTKTVILSGDPGRGKSFMLQKIMLDWASGDLYSENFEAVFHLNYDDLKFIYEDINLVELLTRSLTNQISEILEFIPEKILLLIDGINDFPFDPHMNVSLPTSPSQKAPAIDILMSLLKGQILPESFMLVACRSPSDVLMNLLRGPLRFTEIQGFSEKAVEEYFQKFFLDEQLFKEIYESVKTNETLMTNCSVPLLCWMICYCLKKRFKDVDQVIKELNTTTSIYVQFVSTLLEHHNQNPFLLRSLFRLAEEGILDELPTFEVRAVSELDSPQCRCPFLFRELNWTLQRTSYRFMHLGFQEFFMAFYYVLLDEEQSQRNIRDTLVAESVKGRLSYPILSALLFLCGLSNEDTNRPLFQKYNCSFPYTIRKQMQSLILTLQDEDKLLALHFHYELQDEEFTRRALAGWVSVDLSNVSLRTTDCLVLLYCLRFCPHIRDLNLMYCNLTVDKFRILQPALALCETLRMSVDHLSEVGDLIKALHQSIVLKELNVRVTGLLLDEGLELLKKSLTNPHFTVIIEGFQCNKSTDQCQKQDWGLSCNEKVKLVLMKTMNLPDSRSLDEDFEELEKAFDQNTEQKGSNSSIMKMESLFTEEELEELEELKISDCEASALDLHCQSCVHIADSDQWLQVKPSVCGDEEGMEFRISTHAGRFQCSMTGMRWVCDEDVTLQYRPVDGFFLNAKLERLQYERIAPVIDVNVISGKLEEAHLPHYICLAEAHPALTDSVKLLKVEDDGFIFESVELTRFHAKVLQPTFSPTTLVKQKDIPLEEHLDLLIFMTNKDPLILHVYFFPLPDTFSKETIMKNEMAKNPNNFDIEHPRPDVKFQMNTPHILDVSDADVLPNEGISFSSNLPPNFFMIRHHADGDVEIALKRKHDKVLVWETTVWKQKLIQKRKTKRASKRKRESADLFDNHWTTLIDRVKNVLPVADKLLHQEIISEEQYSVIKDKCSTPQEKMREICLIVRKSDRTGKAKFISFLKKDEPSLLKELEEETSSCL